MDIGGSRVVRKFNGVIHRRCTKCNEWRVIDFFCPSCWNNGGPCRPCSAKDKKEWRKRNQEKHKEYNTNYQKNYYLNNRKKIKVRKSSYYGLHKKEIRAVAMLNYAISTGKLMRPGNCSICGVSGIIIGHHDDYDKPLEVRWVCRSCHNYIHERQYELKEEGKESIPIPRSRLIQEKIVELKKLLHEAGRLIDWRQGSDSSLCRLCGGNVMEHSITCIMDRIERALK
ncbi:MAG: hypothetical protein QME78_10100 [Thermodesulfobacteriota bacterium]|nr:hypothetical protein [Thermodesulfobacteriota bacterium]